MRDCEWWCGLDEVLVAEGGPGWNVTAQFLAVHASKQPVSLITTGIITITKIK